jgi:hypothetical protein
VPPRVADARAGVQDDERHSEPRQMMADGKTCLAATDDDRVQLLSRVCISHDPCLTFCRGT